MSVYELAHRALASMERVDHITEAVATHILLNCVPIPRRQIVQVRFRPSPFGVGRELREGTKTSALMCGSFYPRETRDSKSRPN